MKTKIPCKDCITLGICLNEICGVLIFLKSLVDKCSLLRDYMFNQPAEVKHIHIATRFFSKRKGLLTKRLYKSCLKY